MEFSVIGKGSHSHMVLLDTSLHVETETNDNKRTPLHVETVTKDNKLPWHKYLKRQ
jgi:glycine/serine hydroxymethyltransferase